MRYLFRRSPLLLIAALAAACTDTGLLSPRPPAADMVTAKAAASYHVLAFDVPATMGDFTSVLGVNNRGVLTGNFAAPDGSAHGFIFDGSFTDIVVPGSGPSDHGSLGEINQNGTAIGGYADANDEFHLYLYRRGQITLLPDIPGASGFDASGINDAGTIAGTLFDDDGVQHGFLLKGGQVTMVDHPGGNRTRLFSINDRGAVVGQYFDAGNIRHGFILDNGAMTPVDVPGSTGTAATGINNHGQVVGFYRAADFTVHGFLLDHGQFTTIDFPGSSDTRLIAINDGGLIAGTWDFFSRGMIAVPVRKN